MTFNKNCLNPKSTVGNISLHISMVQFCLLQKPGLNFIQDYRKPKAEEALEHFQFKLLF